MLCPFEAARDDFRHDDVTGRLRCLVCRQQIHEPRTHQPRFRRLMLLNQLLGGRHDYCLQRAIQAKLRLELQCPPETIQPRQPDRTFESLTCQYVSFNGTVQDPARFPAPAALPN